MCGYKAIRCILLFGIFSILNAYKCGDNQVIDRRRVKDITYKLNFTNLYEPKNMGQGPISGDLYFAVDVSVGIVEDQYYYFTRLKETLDLVWKRVYKYRGSSGMFDIDHKEKNVYSAVAELSMTLMQYDANNGDILKVKYCKGLRDQSLSSLIVSPDDSTVFASAQKKTTFFGEICKWTVSNDDNMICRELPNYDIPYIFIPLDNSKVFITIQDYMVLYHANTYNVLTTFDGTQDLWSMKLSCASEICTMLKSKGLYDETENIIYNLWNLVYDELFFTINANNGKFINNKYIWSDYANCYQVITMQRNEDRIYFSYSCRIYMAIASYDIAQDKFVTSYVGDANLYNHVFLKNKIFFSYYIKESIPSYGYMKIGPIEGINSLYDFDIFNHSMVVASGVKDYAFSSNTTLKFTTESWPITPYPDQINEKIDYDLIQKFNEQSDIVFYLEPIYVGKYIHNHQYEIPLNLSCSITGNTSLNFQNGLVGSNSKAWLNVKNETSVSVKAPSVKTETNFTFYVNATTSNRHQNRVYSQLVQITLTPCSKPNCATCSQNVETCTKCIEGFKLKDGNDCVQAYSTYYAEKSGYILQGFLYAFLILIILLKIAGKVEMNLFWSATHNYQMIMLLPALGNTIVTEIVNYLLRSDFLWLSFSFIDFSKAFNIDIPEDCQDNGEYENKARVNYDCFMLNSIQNGFPLLVFLAIVLIIMIIMKILRNKRPSLHLMIESILTNTLLATILIRYFIETFTFMILSSVSSISHLNVKGSYPIASLLINLIYIQGCLFVCVVFSRVILKKRNGDYEIEHDTLIESSRGLQDKPHSHIYIFIFMLRRLLSAICITASLDLTSRGRVGIFIFIQIIWLAYDCLRHFNCLATYIMELYNDTAYIILCILIITWNDMSDWSNPLIGFFYFFISPFGVVVYLITKLVIWHNERKLNLLKNENLNKADSEDLIEINKNKLTESDNNSEELDSK